MCVFTVVQITPIAIQNINWRTFIIFAVGTTRIRDVRQDKLTHDRSSMHYGCLSCTASSPKPKDCSSKT